MKKLFGIILAAAAMVALAGVLAGCSQATVTPTKVTANALNAVKQAEYSAFASYCDGNVSISDANGTIDNMASGEGMTDDQKTTIQKFLQKMISYDFEVSDEQIGGNNATVRVTFKTYDCSTAFKEALGTFLQKAITEAFANAFSGSDSSASSTDQASFYNELENQMASMNDKSMSYSGIVTLVNQDGSWKITAIDDNVKDGMTGGLSSYLTGVASQLGSLFKG